MKAVIEISLRVRTSSDTLNDAQSEPLNALVAQLVEAMVLETIQCEFESHLGYKQFSVV